MRKCLHDVTIRTNEYIYVFFLCVCVVRILFTTAVEECRGVFFLFDNFCHYVFVLLGAKVKFLFFLSFIFLLFFPFFHGPFITPFLFFSQCMPVFSSALARK